MVVRYVFWLHHWLVWSWLDLSMADLGVVSILVPIFSGNIWSRYQFVIGFLRVGCVYVFDWRELFLICLITDHYDFVPVYLSFWHGVWGQLLDRGWGMVHVFSIGSSLTMMDQFSLLDISWWAIRVGCHWGAVSKIRAIYLVSYFCPWCRYSTGFGYWHAIANGRGLGHSGLVFVLGCSGWSGCCHFDAIMCTMSLCAEFNDGGLCQSGLVSYCVALWSGCYHFDVAVYVGGNLPMVDFLSVCAIFISSRHVVGWWTVDCYWLRYRVRHSWRYDCVVRV